MKDKLKTISDYLLDFILLSISLLIVPFCILLIDCIPYIFPINFLATLINMRKGMLFSFLGEVVIVELLVLLLKVSLKFKNKNTYLFFVLDLMLTLALTYSQLITSFAIIVSVAPHLINLFYPYKCTFSSTILFIFKWLFILLSTIFNIFGFSIASILTIIIFIYTNNLKDKKDDIYEKNKIDNID